MSEAKGIAGRIAKKFINSHLIPIFIIASLLTGVMAIFLTPKEEEPQISVPMIDIYTSSYGLDAKEIETKITKVIEKSVWGETGVEYVYSSSMPNQSIVTVRFKVGQNVEESLVKIHHKMMLMKLELPVNTVGPVVKSFTIDDVPFLVATLYSDNVSDYKLRKTAAELANSLSSTPDLSRVDILGGQKRAVRVIADPDKMNKYGISLVSVAQAISSNVIQLPAGKNWSENNVFDIEVGNRIKSADEVGNIAIGQRAGRIIYIKDIAVIQDGPEEMVRGSYLSQKGGEPLPAVSLVFAKRKGTNVVALTDDIIKRIESFNKDADIKVSVVRNYGQTAGEKTDELLRHLLLATISVSILIALVMGFREALVVVVAIPVTLALTLAIYYFLGYTLNRVTLFALIFSIGILVDDAIVVVENIERHLKKDKNGSLANATISAVSEVGNPTILATFTVISAILPMAFVGGMMGPYMAPIPMGASFAMIISLVVAFTVTPWTAIRILKNKKYKESGEKTSKLDSLYTYIMGVLLKRKLAMVAFFMFILLLFVGSVSLMYFQIVKVKLLPFDNKEEFQVLIDYPTNTSLKQNIELSNALAAVLLKDPHVKEVQVFAGEAGPYSFAGLVKHTFLRNADYMSDLQVVLDGKHERKISSHDLIAQLRPVIAEFAEKNHAISKVIEIPPGPPVMSTMVAEIYGQDEETRLKVANDIYAVFKAEKSVVDLDISSRYLRAREVYNYLPQAGGFTGVSAETVTTLGRLLFSETSLALLNDKSAPEDVAIALSVKKEQRTSDKPFKNMTIPSMVAGVVPVASVLSEPTKEVTNVLTRKNLQPVVYVTSELSGAEEAPVYGIIKLAPQIKYPTHTISTPWNPDEVVVKWDGEWFMTYEVFRDLGIAFAVVMVLIYILIVGWFKSFLVPLVIMIPIPISLIGIIPGHGLLGVYFTATSMIGFIAGAGIIVRNSIILVDFIEHQLMNGHPLKEAVISAGVIRFRPMLLTAAAVIVGSSVMLSDPILQGLAVSLIFGEIAATILSRFAVPVLYYYFIGKRREEVLRSGD